MIAITGAAGFIGSNLAHTLAALGHELLLVDHPLSSAKLANWVGLKAFEFVEHDSFLTQLADGTRSPDAIFHLGACSATTETNWQYLTANNIDYTRTLWQWCTTHERPLIYASSAATYGDGTKGFDDRTPPSELTPLNLYGKSKNDFDRWALDAVAAGQPAPPRWAGMKFFNVYGPREAHKGRMSSVVWQTYQQILATGAMKLFRSTDPAYADGGQLRDFVFVEDCIAHMLWLWQHDHPGGLYNSGTGTARSFHALATAVFHAMNREPNISFRDMPPDLAKQYQNYTQATTTKLSNAGCLHPPTSLEAGVRKYVETITGQG